MYSGTLTLETPEQRSSSGVSDIWRRVLIQATKDASGRSGPRRLEIAAWMQSRQFEWVCRKAGVKVAAMTEALKEILLAQDGADRRYRAKRVILVLEAG